MGHRVENDGGAALMGHSVFFDEPEHRRRIEFSQADMGRTHRTHTPGEAPAVAVKHRQGPEVDRVASEPDHHRVAHCRKIGSPVMADDPLGISCGARSIIQTDGVPFIFRHDPFKIRSSFFQKVFIVEVSEPFSPVSFRIVDVDHQQILSGNRQCFPDDRGKLGVGEEDLGFAMLQDVTDGRTVQPDIEGVEHRAGHRHSKMGLEHLRGVRRHHRNGISPTDPPAA